MTEQRAHAFGSVVPRVLHQLNNLLGAVLTNAELIEHPDRLGSSRSLAEAIRHAAERAGRLTRLMHLMADEGPDSPVHCVDFQAGIPMCRELLETILGARISLTIEVAADAGTINVDFGRLLLALSIVAMKARRSIGILQDSSCRPSGEVVLVARPAWPEEYDGLIDSSFVTVCLSDDGPGLSDDQVDQLMASCADKAAVSELPFVHCFCEEAGGRMLVRGTPGMGTAVAMVLPASLPLPLRVGMTRRL